MSAATTLPSLLGVSQGYSSNLPIVNVGTIEDYISYVNSIPILTEEQEQDYTKRLQDESDLKAAHSLVLSHLRYVIKVAKKYLGYGLPLADLIQEGTVGLMKAVRKFDYQRNVRLVTFAMHWIKAEIHEFILKNWRIVKIATTKAQRKLFFKLRSNKKNFNWLNKQEIQQIATDLNVKTKEVKQMELRMFSHDSSFDLPESGSSVQSNTSNNKINNVSGFLNALVPADYLEDNSFNPEYNLENIQWKKIALSKLYKAIGNLHPRYQDILRSRWLQDNAKATLQDLGLNYGVSKERIRQLENQAFIELRKELSQYF
jgi:RNA polymerase sigma-32 factor